MKVTKYAHACFVVQKGNTTIVVDPGNYSHDFIVPSHTDVVVITHEHPDHLDEAHINAILATSPKAVIIGHETIVGRFTDHTTVVAKPGESYQAADILLRFFGGIHAAIAPSIPAPPNIAVLIDDRLYYPGDSFFVPEGVPVKELALPASAPWMKISESMAFLSTIKPTFAFPTHDAILSEDGKALVDRILGTVASAQETTYKRLDGTVIELP